jgi:hypothetical protein
LGEEAGDDFFVSSQRLFDQADDTAKEQVDFPAVFLKGQAPFGGNCCACLFSNAPNC